MNIEYVNENLLPGDVGYFFVVLSFGAALFSFFAYLFYFRNQEATSWRSFARAGFFIHGLAVTGIFVTLFYLIHSHQFQYYYVWEHSSKDLPWYYMISSFWAGQEGSFMLWTIWQFILGGILIFTAKKWEAPVMIVISLSAMMLASMLLGITITNIGEKLVIGNHIFHIPWHLFNAHIKIGNSPFMLLRQQFADQNLPLFNDQEMRGSFQEVIKSVQHVNGVAIVDYHNAIKDGTGLNALLQNYWMVIHPPVLFLGFASTVVPFAFALGSLFNRDYTGWVRPALPWAVFGGLVLGTGILMGGAWAYEALSFGGFWAWDPVENGILVPWLVFIAGLHTMQIYRARKTSLSGSYFFILLTFLLILYSTFLTRSGILGESSVHSFTDLGLSGQLLIFMFVFILLALVFYFVRLKEMPKSAKEENTSSREFWMFIGALILSLSALHIISITSIPVINKINGLINDILHTHLKTNIAPPTNAPATYHMLQIPFAIVIAFLTGIGQFLRYHSTKGKYFWKKILLTAGIGLVFTVIMMVASHLYENWEYILLLFASCFSIAGNIEIFIDMMRKKTRKLTGPAIAHIGLGLILVGALIANGKKETISLNTEGLQVDALDRSSEKEQHENKVLFRNFPEKMSDYTVTFLGDSAVENHLYFKINYKRIDPETKKIKEEFNLYPDIIYQRKDDKNMSPAPSTKHYLTKDIFTHITAASPKETNFNNFPTTPDSFKISLQQGQTIKVDSFDITLEKVNAHTSNTDSNTDLSVTLDLKVSDGFSTQEVHPVYAITGKRPQSNVEVIKEFGLAFIYLSIDPVSKTHQLIMYKGRRPERQYVTLKAIIFPYINLLWAGSFIMILGFIISLIKRIREYKTT
jgi:cytochrome c-type biogenesis protein CcmF